VDDEVSVSTWVAGVLSTHGEECDTALDGQHALSKIASHESGYDVLVTDARMPHMDGWGLIVRARAGGFRGGVIVYSASLDEDEERKRYEALPVDGILKKPASAEELLRWVKQAELKR